MSSGESSLPVGVELGILLRRAVPAEVAEFVGGLIAEAATLGEEALADFLNGLATLVAEGLQLNARGVEAVLERSRR